MRSAMRAIGAATALSLVASGAFAADPVTPLPAGKPAGVHQAALEGPGILILTGLAVVGIGLAFALSNNGKNSPTTPTTTGTVNP
jgi:hypothetical protein